MTWSRFILLVLFVGGAAVTAQVVLNFSGQSGINSLLKPPHSCPNCDLRAVKLVGLNLTGANLSQAQLNKADLRCSNLSGANLTRANLEAANLTGTKLKGADLLFANTKDAIWNDGTDCSKL